MPILDPGDDIADLLAFLRREPVLNTIALGLLKEAADATQRSRLFLATVEREGRIVAAAFRADFPKMGLSAEGDAEAMAELAGLVQPAMPDLPCIMGKDEQLEPFVAEWTRLSGERGTPGMPEQVHELRAVRPQQRDFQPRVRRGRLPAGGSGERGLVSAYLTARTRERPQLQTNIRLVALAMSRQCRLCRRLGDGDTRQVRGLGPCGRAPPVGGGVELAGNDPASETASHGTSTSLDRN